jgi:hypothetical protein
VAYTANLLLRSATVMQDEVAWADQAAKTDPVKIIWDIPEHKHQDHATPRVVTPSAIA